MPATTEEYEKRIRYEFAQAQIVELDGNPIGLYKAKYDQELNYWYLIQIQIDPKYRGLQIGSSLIRNLIAKTQGSGAMVGLDVISTNPAKHLYTKLGFKCVESTAVELRMELKTETHDKIDEVVRVEEI